MYRDRIPKKCEDETKRKIFSREMEIKMGITG
jgi:hypothetical protein